MRCYIPAFDADVRSIVRTMSDRTLACYLRLGRSELQDERDVPGYAPWRRLQEGNTGVVIAVGPIAGGLWRALRERPAASRPALWVVSELDETHAPMAPPEELLETVSKAPRLGLAEEHVAQGGFGQQFLHFLATRGQRIPTVVHAHAQGYPSGRYGSQAWHRNECGLDVPAILARL
jgi:transketolase